MFKAIMKRRSIRRYKQMPVALSVLKKLVDAARLAPSAGNFQPIEYILLNKKSVVNQIFEHLRWAVYLKGKGTPSKDQRPVAIIVILINKKRAKFPFYTQVDMGAAIENILLAATEKGLGSCWFGSIDRPKIARDLSVPKSHSVEYVVALGYPDEKSVVFPMKKTHKYHKDEKNVIHVPKRTLKSILHLNKY
ncbi:MAG: nitroreductase [Candidatus Omnitrophica bacterium]|nr:nitroreductase [Candidatus Omnitrophota bacterium]